MELKLSLAKSATDKMKELGLSDDDIGQLIARDLERIGVENPEGITLHVIPFEEGGDITSDSKFWMLIGPVHDEETGEMDDTILVCTGSFIEVDMPEEGNFGPGGTFEGKKLMVPVPDLGDDDEEESDGEEF